MEKGYSGSKEGNPLRPLHGLFLYGALLLIENRIPCSGGRGVPLSPSGPLLYMSDAI